MRAAGICAVLVGFALVLGAGVGRADDVVADATSTAQGLIQQGVIEPVRSIPSYLLQPRSAFAKLFASEPGFPAAVTFAAAMILVGFAVASVLNAPRKVEMSSISLVYLGTVVLWMAYAVFLHGFAFVWGARRGVEPTIIAYLYVMGMLQPIFAILLSTLSRLFQKQVEHREILGRTFGGSGAGFVVARGKFFSEGVVMIFRTLAGVLILVYFAIALAEAQQISLLRAALASFCSLLFWLVAYAIVSSMAVDGRMRGVLRLFNG